MLTVLLQQKNNLSEANAMIQELENKLRADEAIRRKLHNTILELKGNIRVFCRVRPALGNENADGSALSHLSFANNDGIEVISKSVSATCFLLFFFFFYSTSTT